MNRLAQLSGSALLVMAVAWASGRPDDEVLAAGTLQHAFGGNVNSAKCKQYCDVAAGLLDRCAFPGDFCRQCLTVVNGNLLASTFDELGAAGGNGCTPNGGFKLNNNAADQNCGSVWMGTCQIMPNGELACIVNNTGAICLQGRKPVVPQ